MDPGGAINVHRGLNISAYFSPPVLIFRNIWTGVRNIWTGVIKFWGSRENGDPGSPFSR